MMRPMRSLWVLQPRWRQVWRCIAKMWKVIFSFGLVVVPRGLHSDRPPKMEGLTCFFDILSTLFQHVSAMDSWSSWIEFQSLPLQLLPQLWFGGNHCCCHCTASQRGGWQGTQAGRAGQGQSRTRLCFFQTWNQYLFIFVLHKLYWPLTATSNPPCSSSCPHLFWNWGQDLNRVCYIDWIYQAANLAFLTINTWQIIPLSGFRIGFDCGLWVGLDFGARPIALLAYLSSWLSSCQALDLVLSVLSFCSFTSFVLTFPLIGLLPAHHLPLFIPQLLASRRTCMSSPGALTSALQ